MSFLRTLGSLVVVALLAACGSAEPESLVENDDGAVSADVLPASNLRKAERLRALADAADPRKYPYDNETLARRALELATAADPGPRKFQLLVEAVLELVRAGRPGDALERLDEAETLLAASGARITADTEISLLELRVAAGLRLGEQENCLLHASADACILPIQAAATHEQRRGSSLAREALERLLELRPESSKYRWLLNLAAMTLGEYPDGVPSRYLLPPSALDLGEEGASSAAGRFVNRASEVGVGWPGRAGGAAMDDFDGDGRLDLAASSWGLYDPLKLFRQRPDGTFEDHTELAGLAGQLGGINLSHADFDNDGDVDLLVLRGGWLFDAGDQPDSLLRNEGGRFVDVTQEAGVSVEQPAHSGAWADFDGDGWLDLFVGAEPSGGVRHPSRLYRNLGDGTFEEVAAELGLEVQGIVKAVTWGDFDDDGHPDLYVSRFAEPNLLYRNLGPGRGFRNVTALAGVGEPRESFPAWFFDADNDGRLDLFVASFAGFFDDSLAEFVAPYFGGTSQTVSNRLYRNLGGGSFEDITERAGLNRMTLAMGANFGDLDGDGYLDLYLGTGEPTMTTLVPNLALRNVEGRRFEDITSSTGLGSLQKGHGVAFGDLDADGDEDLYVTMGGAYSGDVFPNLLFESPASSAGKGFLTLQLRGRASNRSAVGARVTVRLGEESYRTLHRVVGTGGSFGSSSLQLEIGVGDARTIESVDVRWPGSNRRVRYRGLAGGTRVSVPESTVER